MKKQFLGAIATAALVSDHPPMLSKSRNSTGGGHDSMMQGMDKMKYGQGLRGHDARMHHQNSIRMARPAQAR